MHVAIIQKIIDIIRGKEFQKAKERKQAFKKNEIAVAKSCKNKIHFTIKGVNNKITIPETCNILKNVNIYICGNNNKVIFDENLHVGSLTVVLGQHHPYFGDVNNSSFIINKNSSIDSLTYTTYNSNTFCTIEENCMLSYGITIYNTDAHPIFKKGTDEVINKVKGITIGKHSWIGMNVTILKNSIIPSNSIVGCNSVFSGGQCQPYCAFAGNPARIIKENVDWDANGAKYGYIKKEDMIAK